MCACVSDVCVLGKERALLGNTALLAESWLGKDALLCRSVLLICREAGTQMLQAAVASASLHCAQGLLWGLSWYPPCPSDSVQVNVSNQTGELYSPSVFVHEPAPRGTVS